MEYNELIEQQRKAEILIPGRGISALSVLRRYTTLLQSESGRFKQAISADDGS